MKSIASELVILALGTASALLTAGLVVGFDLLTGFNLLGFALWAVIPVGALFLGFGAASGYYLGARLLDRRPGILPAIGMVVLALSTQWLVYGAQYATMKLADGTSLSSAMRFGDFLAQSLTNARLRVQFVHVHLPELPLDTRLGTWGYAFAVLQAVGLLVGGASLFLFLASRHYCRGCGRYLKKQESSRFVIPATEPPEKFIVAFQRAVPLSDPYFELLRSHRPKPPSSEGDWHLTVSLWKCPLCGGTLLEEAATTVEGDKQQLVPVPEGSRLIRLPTELSGVSVTRAVERSVGDNA